MNFPGFFIFPLSSFSVSVTNLPFIHTICKPSAVFAPLEVDSIVKSIIDYETKKYIRSELLIKDNLPILYELLNKKFN